LFFACKDKTLSHESGSKSYLSSPAKQNGQNQVSQQTANDTPADAKQADTFLYSTVNKRQNLNDIKTKFDTFQVRSKTPGPEIYRQSLDKEQQQVSPRGLQQPQHQANSQKNLRSKTPTADMYYTFNSSNSKQRDSNFDTIYTPFMMQSAVPQAVQRQHINNNEIDYKYIDILVELHRQDNGFGFRIVGGEEEGSQVNVGYIVPNGSADLDGRLKVHDEILMIDNENVVNASHKRVVRLMTIAGLNRKVKLWVRRRVPITVSTVVQQIGKYSPIDFMASFEYKSDSCCLLENQYPCTLTLFRNGNEGFGFVIISTLNRSGPSIGKCCFSRSDKVVKACGFGSLNLICLKGNSNLHPYSWIGTQNYAVFL
jgi:hypothetical protein